MWTHFRLPKLRRLRCFSAHSVSGLPFGRRRSASGMKSAVAKKDSRPVGATPEDACRPAVPCPPLGYCLFQQRLSIEAVRSLYMSGNSIQHYRRHSAEECTAVRENLAEYQVPHRVPVLFRFLCWLPRRKSLFASVRVGGGGI